MLAGDRAVALDVQVAYAVSVRRNAHIPALGSEMLGQRVRHFLSVGGGGFYSHGVYLLVFCRVQRDDINALMPQKVNRMAAHIVIYF